MTVETHSPHKEAHSPLKHVAIAATLEGEIRTGRIALGKKLAGEHALAHRFSVSRNTIRRALTQLHNHGLIVTHTGRGSYVTFGGDAVEVRRGWAVAFEDRAHGTIIDDGPDSAEGDDFRGEVVRREVIVDTALAERLATTSAQFIAIDRIRRAPGGRAIALERSRVPVTGTLLDLPQDGDRREQWVTGRGLTTEEADLLGRQPSEWFLQSTRISRTAAGDFVEYVDAVLDPETLQLHLRVEW